MMVRIPGTGKVTFLPAHTSDHVLDLTQYPDEIDETQANEDVVVVGNWSDYSGEGTKQATEVPRQGLPNDNMFDLDAAIAHVKDPERTDRGNLVSTHRTRPKLQTVELPNG